VIGHTVPQLHDDDVARRDNSNVLCGTECASRLRHPMSNAWKNEDDIKAELRVLTEELRTLRHELRNMVAPPKPHNLTRALLHRQTWPMTPPPAAEAPERNRTGGAKQKKKR
jgi:hypothetical protein